MRFISICRRLLFSIAHNHLVPKEYRTGPGYSISDFGFRISDWNLAISPLFSPLFSPWVS